MDPDGQAPDRSSQRWARSRQETRLRVEIRPLPQYTGAAMAITALKRPPALEKFVAAQVKQGAYRSRQAAIVAAVSKEKRRAEQQGWLDEQLKKGLASESAGELNIEDVIRRGRARQVARKRRARA